ncbi:sigma 54-interacting transcriptional regulator [Salinisphaera sp. SPP-AMP-43]|uniref:sigma-54 interaction domain-containing protein n=1 Tax=Salinisphaera sp. SPP-AMP-43 TaxID=3121288 RepID=UPI003C6DD966
MPTAADRVLATLVETTHEHLLIADSQGRVLAASPSLAAVYGVTPAELADTDVYALEAAGVLRPSITRQVIETGRETRLRQITSTGRAVLAEAYPVFDDHGVLVRVLSRSRDATDLRHLQDEYQALMQDLARRDEAGQGPAEPEPMAASAAMREVLRILQRVAPIDIALLMTGESGSGKTALARRVHAWSPRADGPCVEINCGAIPPSLFESEMFGSMPGAFTGAPAEGRAGHIEAADGGTLILDEIAELGIAMQAKLLEVLQARRVTRLGANHPTAVDIRVIAVTSRDLGAQVTAGRFRSDLYYRLNVVPVRIPPLRERRAEIPALAEAIMARLNERYGDTRVIDDRRWGFLMSHGWPGNIRELENLLEREWLESQPAIQARVGDDGASGSPLAEAVAAVERQCLVWARTQADSTHAMADMLGINQASVVRKLRRHGLAGPDRHRRSINRRR